MSKQKEIVRDYKFSDGKLKQKADLCKLNIARTEDAIVFATRLVDPATLLAFQGLITDFDEAPGDEILRGTVSEAASDKDAKAEALRVSIRTIRTMAQNKWGVGHASYRKYGFDRLNDTPDETLHRLARTVGLVAPGHLTLLAGEGLTQLMIDNIETLDQDFDAAIDTHGAAEGDRDTATQNRIEKGNLVYKELTRLCNIGKDLYASTDEARYNDYVIYKTKTGEAPEEGTEFGSLSGTITDGQTGEVIPDAEVKLKGTDIPDIVLQADENGEYDAESAPVEITTVEVTMFGYELSTTAVTITPGDDIILDIILTPVTPPVPPPTP